MQSKVMRVGGGCDEKKRRGGGCREYRFDTGPSLLLFPQVYRETFQEIGVELPDLLEVEPTAYRVIFEDAPPLDLLTDEDKMARQLDKVEAGAGESFGRMLKASRVALEVGVDAFIARSFTSFADFINPVRLIPLLPKLFEGGIINPLELLFPLDAWLRQFFESPHIRALFTFQTLYVGLTPFNAPSAFSLLAATELTDGVWYPKGGFGQITEALDHAARDCGVVIDTETSVERVVVEDGRVRGVTLSSGKRIDADIVICNADLPYAKRELLEGRSAAVDRSMEYSAGIIEFCWGVADGLDGLSQHNVFLSREWEDSWIRPGSAKGKLFPQVKSGNFYCHVPSKTDPSASTGNGHSVMILFPVAHKGELSGADYTELVAWSREVIVQRFSQLGIDIEPAIECESIVTPDEWESDLNLQNGAAFGLSHGLSQLGWFRPGHHRRGGKDAEGLYYVGASTHPGNGVPLVLTGSRLVCSEILSSVIFSKKEEDRKKKRRKKKREERERVGRGRFNRLFDHHGGVGG